MKYEIKLIGGPKLILAPFNKTFITPKYQGWFDDPVATRYNSHGVFPHSKEGTEQFLQDIESEKILVWAIIIDAPRGVDASGTEPHTNKIHMGNISLQSINWVNRSAELTILIGEKEYWGKGIGKAVCGIVLDHAFNLMNLSRIWTGTAVTNFAMQKICVSLDMKQEGRFRQGVYLNGRYEDVYCYGILKDE